MIVPRLRMLAAIAAALATIALVLVASGKSAVAVTSLVNGNFEMGDLTGWTADTTASDGAASAVASYDYSYQVSCTGGDGAPCYDIATIPPHEGSYFALLTSGKPSWNSPTPTDTKISQPFKASNGDKVSGWAFFKTYDWLGSPTPGTPPQNNCPVIEGFTWKDSEQCRDKGQVVVTSDSGTKVVATPFYESESSVGSYGNSGWKYWEYTFSDLTGEGEFQIEARVGSAVYNGMSDMGLDDVKTSTNAPDTTKPSTSVTRSVEPNAAGWNKENVTVKLNATDNEGGWGVKEITYRINGGQPITKQGASVNSAMTVEVPLTAEGTTTLTYYATDKAGNVEAPKTLTVKIDKTAPTVKSTSPATNATGVSPLAKISTTFVESGAGMDPDTLNNTNYFKVEQVKSSGNVAVSGTRSYDAASKTVTFTPSNNLAKGTYRATLTTGVEDKADNALANVYTWSFRR